METKQAFFAVNREDGSVAIMGFVTVGMGTILPSGAEWIADGWWKREPTHESVFEEISRAFATGPAVTSYFPVDPASLPADRSYRDAWTHDGTGIVHDMNKAREIHREKLRRRRVALFEANDLKLRDAILDTDLQAQRAAKAERNRLRDVTKHPEIEKARTIEELKGLRLLDETI